MDSLPALETAVTTALNPVCKVRALTALATALSRAGETRRAYTHAQDARELAAHVGDPRLDAETRHAVARCFFHLADFKPALELLLEAAQHYEDCGDLAAALACHKEYHVVREAELAGSARDSVNNTDAAQLWVDFQDASRRASQYRAQAESLAADHAALTKEAKALTEASQHDPLTGLLNRRGLDARIGALVAASEVNDVPLTIALIDVDLFKRINDSFSHTTGDVVLRRVASFIRSHCRQHDLPVRYGGDEFLLVLADVDTPRGLQVLERLKRACDGCDWQNEAPGLVVTLSIGVATRPRGDTIAATIAAADRALYEAKTSGRDRIAVQH